ncbi:MAG TPA: hydrogenase 3 maturation endopeptidase HyCI [Candidatus Bathyarchaeia archaeon]
MTRVKYGIRENLKIWLANSERIVVAGIGNSIRSDDFVGLKIVQDLKGKVSNRVCLIECETVPESFMDEIVELKPSHVLLVDAAVMGLEPGKVRLLDAEKVTEFPPISTHMLPLRVFCDYIVQLTKTKIALLLIEPGNTEFGESLTLKVEAAAEKLTSILSDLLN